MLYKYFIEIYLIIFFLIFICLFRENIWKRNYLGISQTKKRLKFIIPIILETFYKVGLNGNYKVISSRIMVFLFLLDS